MSLDLIVIVNGIYVNLVVSIFNVLCVVYVH